VEGVEDKGGGDHRAALQHLPQVCGGTGLGRGLLRAKVDNRHALFLSM
jgi:hypothetical protein